MCRIKLTLALVALLMLAGCAGSAAQSDDPYSDTEDGWTKVAGNLWRAVDEDAGMVCYALDDRRTLECYPIEQTDLTASGD